MSDVKVIRHLLANYAPLTAVVAAARIVAGPVPQGAALPAVSVLHISGVWNKEISRQGQTCTARVQVTVFASTYSQQKQVLRLIRDAVPRTRGLINGVAVNYILREPDGPDFPVEAEGIFMQTQDFMVNFTDQ